MTALPRPWRRKLGSDARAAYVFLAPALIGFTVFVVYPLIRSAYFALTQYNGLSDPKFVGFDNFRRMFTTDPSFWPSVRATLLLVVLYVPLSLAIGLALAVFCNQRMRGVSLLRTLCYVPVVLPVVATITLWKFVFNPQVGLANQVLSWLHLPTSEWLSGSDSAMPSIVIVMLWSVGSTMIIFLAALQAVPTELYEAARLDGAGPRTVFFRITLPLISPIMVLQVVLQMVTALQAFNQPKILSPDGMGGPGFSTRVLMLSIYTNGFPSLGRVAQLGYASAQVWVLFLVIVVLIAATARFSSIWTYSDHVS
ncbi:MULTISPECIES: carbohydrate ABC transporter permease [Streptomyces]|uniref:Sugar ABC transporter permease n=1 Tax=Streptomyces mirabilis TaxID=68239 RepID=A0ABU3UCN0_9ACTN|nr:MULTISPECIES: sugar ABC transporter permease [Streptomyces]MCX4616554.1 sugar ABC transporter permease [Streptomyces mirabilis]MCX5354779.1 sugar ABC transporter permease [Streptomyces mirabilis]MDU8991649.1 sugar ABC transporter permease [Streptomyces mirabilis]